MSLIDILKSRLSAFLHDSLMVPLAWVGAFWLRFNLGRIPADNLQIALMSLVVILPIQLMAFWQFGLYRGIWRFASIPDLVRIFKAVVFGVLVSSLILFAINRLDGVPRSVPLLYAILLVFLLSGPRFIYRWFKDHRLYLRSGKRVLIVGAGKAGEMLVRDLVRDSHGIYQPVAFVDDDAQKMSKDIHGIRVMGKVQDIPDLVRRLQIDVIMIAIPSCSSVQMRIIVEICETTDVPIRTLPRFTDIISGQVSHESLRKVSIEDLLGRDPVTLDMDSLKRGIGDRCVLVTGAGGSIGSELCHQICKLAPSRIVLIDNAEFNLYSIDQDLEKYFPGVERKIYLDDVSDRYAMSRIIEDHKPDIVFHAAAYKHVPLLQGQVRRAVHNNIIGTSILASVCATGGVETFVLISTDKAVNPTNIMGTTKRIAEMICKQMNAQHTTRFITVRFGNVLGSAGSVVPLFRRQIEAGGPVTVTHPEITRYFMTIPEACQLIMQASVMGTGGETFVLDMGDPVKIRYLAEQMITLAGKTPDVDIEIIYTGLRPGEKLYEELFYDRELLVGTNIEKIMLSRYRDDLSEFQVKLEQLFNAYNHNDDEEMIVLLHDIVPEFIEKPSDYQENVVYLGEHRQTVN